MKRLLLFLASLPLLAQPTISSTAIDDISHSTARASATASSVPSGGTRIRYGLTSSFEMGMGGGLNNQEFTYCFNDVNVCPGIYQIYGTLSGLQGNSLYFVCLQGSTDGITWSSCSGSATTTFTTLSDPTPDPAYPVAPETFTTTYPNTSMYSVAALATSCSDLNSKLSNAVLHRGTGWILPIAPGLLDTVTSTVCLIPPVDPSALPMPTSAINTSTNTITIASNGLTLNQPVRFSTAFDQGNCLPSTMSCSVFGNLIVGTVYYVISPTTNTFQVSATIGGSAVVLSDVGVGTNYVVPQPAPGGPEIIIRTSTLDNQFCEIGERCLGALWQPAMATIKVAGGQWNTHFSANYAPMVFQTQVGAHDIRFMGIEMTQTDVGSLANTSTDPAPTYGIFVTNFEDCPTRIILDRDYIHGLGYPNRIYRPITNFDGKYMAIIDTDLELWDYWRPWETSNTVGVAGFVPSISVKTVSFTSSGGDTYYMGTATCTAPSPLSITFTGGTVTSSAFGYFDMGCVPTYSIPTGMTAACAGTGSNHGGAGQACVINTTASPAFPVDSAHGSGLACGMLAQITLTAGTPTAAGFQQGFSQFITEGTNGLIAGWGPGPFQIYNNTISGAGLLFHFDGGASGHEVPGPKGYVVQRNSFALPSFYLPANGHLDYQQRNHLEWKNGTNAKLDGNVCSGMFAEVSAQGPCFVLSGLGVGWVTDFEISNNSFQGGATAIVAEGGITAGALPGVSGPLNRLWIHNNLLNAPNGYTNFANVAGTAASDHANTWLLETGVAMEDMRIEHNTLYNMSGGDPLLFHWIQNGNPMQGASITDNFIWGNNDNNSYGINSEGSVAGNTPNCTGIAKAFTDCAFLNGIGNISYTFGGNVFVPYWTNSQNNTSAVSPTNQCTEWGGSAFSPNTSCTGLINLGFTNYLRGDSTPAARLAAIGFNNVGTGDFSLSSMSPYHNAGSDGTDVGVNMLALQNAQGVVQAFAVPTPGSTSATATATTPDTQGCSVDVTTNAFSTFTRFAQAGGSTSQSTALTGLTAATTYQARLNCAVQQPIVSFTTASGSTGVPVAGPGVAGPGVQ